MSSKNTQKLNELTSELIKNQPKLIEYDLKRLELAMTRLGSPQSDIKNIIHVAGTNGKGSTIANLKALLKGHGFSVNSFTSPHLINPSERININGTDIADKQLLDLLMYIIENTSGIPLSYFELLTCAGFIAFNKLKSDFTLMEVGLGGRKDATNIIRAPKACVITPISLDHQEFLGSTLSKIAYEKAGIIKYKTPTFIGRQKRSVMKVIKAEAEYFDCPLFVHGKDWKIRKFSRKWCVEIQDNLIELDSKALKGYYQLENSALALATLHYLKSLKNTHSNTFLSEVVWPGRFHYLRRGPIYDILTKVNKGNKIILDGAHNPSAAKAVAKEIANNKWENIYLILAMQRNKDLIGFMKPFEGLVKKVFVIESNEENFLTPAEIKSKLTARDFDIYTKKTVQSAAKTIAKISNVGSNSIIITGSLYFIGRILENNS